MNYLKKSFSVKKKEKSENLEKQKKIVWQKKSNIKSDNLVFLKKIENRMKN